MTAFGYTSFVSTCGIYPNKGNNFVYPTLGLVGEAGEVAEKIKKILRDKNGVINHEDKYEIIKELGDVLWYLTAIGTEIGSDLQEILDLNVAKLESRRQRGVQSGSGDNR